MQHGAVCLHDPSSVPPRAVPRQSARISNTHHIRIYYKRTTSTALPMFRWNLRNRIQTTLQRAANGNGSRAISMGSARSSRIGNTKNQIPMGPPIKMPFPITAGHQIQTSMVIPSSITMDLQIQTRISMLCWLSNPHSTMTAMDLDSRRNLNALSSMTMSRKWQI